jgi:hypothetical protein
MVVSGATGCGKTHLLRRLAASGQQVLDLEFLAKHKGARQHPGSRMRFFSTLDPRSASKNISILTQKNFLISRKYDPGCSSLIRILIFYPSRNPDPGDKKAPDPDPYTDDNSYFSVVLHIQICANGHLGLDFFIYYRYERMSTKECCMFILEGSLH